MDNGFKKLVEQIDDLDTFKGVNQMSLEAFAKYFYDSACIDLEAKNKQLEEELERVEGLKQLYFRRWYDLKKVYSKVRERNKQLEGLLKEACNYLVENMKIDSDLYGDGDYDHEQFLNKDLIKELMKSNTINKKE